SMNSACDACRAAASAISRSPAPIPSWAISVTSTGAPPAADGRLTDGKVCTVREDAAMYSVPRLRAGPHPALALERPGDGADFSRPGEQRVGQPLRHLAEVDE